MREYSYAFAAVDNSELRLEWISKLEEECFRIAILVHPRSYVAPSAQLCKGTLVGPMAVVNTDSVLATGCIIAAGAVVDQNCFIGDGCRIGVNAAGSIYCTCENQGGVQGRIYTEEVYRIVWTSLEREGQCIANT